MNTAPLFWIEELRILRSWSAEQSEEVRRISFRQGLNIVWATVSSDIEPELPGFGGHAAGKTSLCRLLRFVLGEPHYGSRFMRDRILRAFENGWVAAKIWINDTPWIVARAFRSGHHPLALQTEKVENIFADEETPQRFDDFRTALEGAIVSPLPLQEFPSEKEPITFLHLLQWVAKDQECRLAGLLDWRHESSNHGSPKMFAEQRRFLIRDVLNLVDELVRDEIIKRHPSEVELAGIPEEIAFHRRNLQAGLNALRMDLEPEPIPNVGESLFVDTVRRIAQNKRDSELSPLDEKVRSLNFLELQRTLNRLNQDLGAKRFQENELQEHLDQQKLNLSEAERDGTEAGYSQFWERLRPADQYCQVPISIARFRCPLRQEFEPIPTSSPLKPDLAKISEAAKTAIRDLQQNIVPVKAAKLKLEDSIQNLEAKISSVEQEVEKLRTKRVGVIEKHTLTLFRANEAVDACKCVEVLEGRQKQLETEIENSKQRQQTLQDRQKKEMTDFSGLFESTVQAILGGPVEAHCRFTREEISPYVDYHGELSSGAIDTLKIIAFDIAVMRSSIFHGTHHPRFLILDSPREADMHPTPYQRIFHHLKSLEISEFLSPFQVILTTTEPPPVKFQDSPELILRLDASKKEQRLFRRDL